MPESFFGISKLSNTGIFMQGGIETILEISSGIYRLHRFPASCSLVVINGGKVDVLIVGAGGSGGWRSLDWYGAGGGAAGGLIYTTYSPTPGIYPVAVGPTTINHNNGANSSIFGLIAYGGGRGANQNENGGDGGSGGGGTQPNLTAGNGTGGQGNNGGAGYGGAGTQGGGGGGAGGAGQAGLASSAGGDGGIGLTCSITGVATYYAGGGGGANGGDASLGGGAYGGQNTNGLPGTDGLGGGGGGVQGGPVGGYLYTGGNGGSGIVIVRYLIG